MKTFAPTPSGGGRVQFLDAKRSRSWRPILRTRRITQPGWLGNRRFFALGGARVSPSPSASRSWGPEVHQRSAIFAPSIGPEVGLLVGFDRSCRVGRKFLAVSPWERRRWRFDVMSFTVIASGAWRPCAFPGPIGTGGFQDGRHQAAASKIHHQPAFADDPRGSVAARTGTPVVPPLDVCRRPASSSW